LHHARMFAALLATRLAKVSPPDCIIPIPLHPSRQRERGFNQAIEIARPLSQHMGCHLDIETCIRTQPTPPQSLLSGSQRRNNLRGAFALTRPLQARHVALIDDVMTTGSTLNAVSNLLRHGGAKRIDVWVCARTHRNQ
jgi:ComF family protein